MKANSTFPAHDAQTSPLGQIVDAICEGRVLQQMPACAKLGLNRLVIRWISAKGLAIDWTTDGSPVHPRSWFTARLLYRPLILPQRDRVDDEAMIANQSRPRCGSRFLDPACSAMIAAGFRSHLGDVG
jgi:hypothetical protein